MNLSNRPVSLENPKTPGIVDQIGQELRGLFPWKPNPPENNKGKKTTVDPRVFSERFLISMHCIDKETNRYDCKQHFVSDEEWSRQTIAKRIQNNIKPGTPLPESLLENHPLPNSLINLILAVRKKWEVPLDCTMTITLYMGFRTSETLIGALAGENPPKYGGRILTNWRCRDLYYLPKADETRDWKVLKELPNRCFFLQQGEGLMLPPGLFGMYDVWISNQTSFTGPSNPQTMQRGAAPQSGIRSNVYDRITAVIDLHLSPMLTQKISNEFMGGGTSGGNGANSGGEGNPAGLNQMLNDPRLRAAAKGGGLKSKINKDTELKKTIEEAVGQIRAYAPSEVETDAIDAESALDHGLKVIGGEKTIQEAVRDASTHVPSLHIETTAAEEAEVLRTMNLVSNSDNSTQTESLDSQVNDEMAAILGQIAASEESKSSTTSTTTSTTTSSSSNPSVVPTPTVNIPISTPASNSTAGLSRKHKKNAKKKQLVEEIKKKQLAEKSKETKK